MPRRNRCVLPDVACHITQRGVDRRETFSTDTDRFTYLRLVRENLNPAGVKLLGWCLMTNHIHLVAIPAREDSLSILMRRVHGRYARKRGQPDLRSYCFARKADKIPTCRDETGVYCLMLPVTLPSAALIAAKPSLWTPTDSHTCVWFERI